MPRRRADKVIEHRLSLSDGLHKEMKKTLASRKIESQIAMAGNGAKAIMNVGAVAAIGAIGYLGVKAYAEAKGVFPQVKDSFQKAWDWGFGVETNADGSIVPTTVTITNIHGDEETVVNPINSIPVLNKVPGLGGLFDWGMKLGAATNPFEDDEATASFLDDLTGFTWEEQQQYESYVNPDWDQAAWDAAKAAEFERQQSRFDFSEADFDWSAFGSSWAAGMEAEMRETMGDEWVDARLAEDPNFFAWKAVDITEGIGFPEMDFSALEGMRDWEMPALDDYLLDGRSPLAEDRSMNIREWREWVAQVEVLEHAGTWFPTIDLSWTWYEYRPAYLEYHGR